MKNILKKIPITTESNQAILGRRDRESPFERVIFEINNCGYYVA